MKLHKRTVKLNIRTLISEFTEALLGREKIIKEQREQYDILQRKYWRLEHQIEELKRGKA